MARRSSLEKLILSLVLMLGFYGITHDVHAAFTYKWDPPLIGNTFYSSLNEKLRPAVIIEGSPDNCTQGINEPGHLLSLNVYCSDLRVYYWAPYTGESTYGYNKKYIFQENSFSGNSYDKCHVQMSIFNCNPSASLPNTFQIRRKLK